MASAHKYHQRLLLLLMLLYLAAELECSLYDPHLYPTHGPFFEGWYIRAVDGQRSFGIVFGKVLAADPAQVQAPAFLGILYEDPDMGPKLYAYDDLPPAEIVTVTVGDGEPVTANPSVDGPSHFRWVAGRAGYIEVTPEGAVVDVKVEGVELQAEIGPAHPWSKSGEGPQGWLQYLPLSPLAWFVYSTRSPLLSYSIHFPHTPQNNVQGNSGLVHMEKNWGNSFPTAWVWSQGMSQQNNVTYAIGYGPVNFGPITLPGHLGGYRNSDLGLHIDFRPDNSYIVVSQDACRADILITIYTLNHKVIVHLFAAQKTFSDCIYGPTTQGFRELSEETYSATAEVLVFERNLLTYKEIDSQSIPLAGLEFGGLFTCNDKCREL